MFEVSKSQKSKLRPVQGTERTRSAPCLVASMLQFRVSFGVVPQSAGAAGAGERAGGASRRLRRRAALRAAFNNNIGKWAARNCICFTL